MIIDPKDAFLHLIYDYRYLAQAGGAWSIYGPPGTSEDQKAANTLLPGIGVTILDSLLLHTRSLIDFYTKPTVGRRNTDILLPDFDNLSINAALSSRLLSYKKPVEVHVLHLTSWRDTAQSNRSAVFARPDWNTEAAPLAQLVLDALQDAANQASIVGSKWTKALGDLHAAATNLLNDPAHNWPSELGEKQDVTAYLISQGL